MGADEFVHLCVMVAYGFAESDDTVLDEFHRIAKNVGRYLPAFRQHQAIQEKMRKKRLSAAMIQEGLNGVAATHSRLNFACSSLSVIGQGVTELGDELEKYGGWTHARGCWCFLLGVHMGGLCVLWGERGGGK